MPAEFAMLVATPAKRDATSREPLELKRIARMIRLLRTREVRHQQRDFEMFEARGMRVRRRKPESIHAGIDLNRNWSRPIRPPCVELRVGVDDRNQIVFGSTRRFDIGHTFQNVDLRYVDDVAQRDAFGDRCDEEGRAAFRDEARSNRAAPSP